ncbi:MAG: 50S ribosomal protein L18 [Gemmatimonadetes bacterium]|nr:50S ribosomal protein L18 [Gemmatimonadota bacterium]
MAKMGNLTKSRRAQRARRHRRIRKKIQGTAERPRLVVFRSIKNIEGQLVDDDSSRTLVGVSILAEELRGFTGESQMPNVEKAFEAGKLLADKAKAAGVETVVFDRGGYKYHGRVKAFAEGARKGGLEF